MEKHQLTMSVLMTPDLANLSGNVHSGSILKLLDQVAYACAATEGRRQLRAEFAKRVASVRGLPG